MRDPLIDAAFLFRMAFISACTTYIYLVSSSSAALLASYCSCGIAGGWRKSLPACEPSKPVKKNVKKNVKTWKNYGIIAKK